jgi:hypothetical protein
MAVASGKDDYYTKFPFIVTGGAESGESLNIHSQKPNSFSRLSGILSITKAYHLL